MRILITGGTGFIGQALCKHLEQANHELLVVSRSPDRARELLPAGTKTAASALDFLDDRPEAVINLAGESIAAGRWTDRRKREIIDSRIEATRGAVKLCARQDPAPQILVSASAMGWYGDQGDHEVTEDTPPNKEFAHQICAVWEAEALKARDHGTRVAIARIGLVLDQGGGMLERVLPPFKMGVGGRLGDGRQYMPWIHRHDMVRILEFLLEGEALTGPFNASAPKPVTNAEFSATLARRLSRPALLPAPAAALKLAFGEMSRLLLTGADMRPARLLQAGFEFDYPTLDSALAEILER